MDLRSDKIERSNLVYHEVLGRGGCGVVYRATFKKPYKDHSEAAAKSLTHLRREEIEILRRLRHENIVNMLGFYEDGPMKVIFFEYTPYGSLHQYLERDDSKPLPNELRRRWAMEAALAVQYLHKKKILHRDIKASNCLLFYNDPGTLKLCDFGLAKDIDHSQTTSTQKGTYRYWAPEIIQTDDKNHAIFSNATDVWAYGMLVFEICSRKLPFYDKEWQTVIWEVGRGDSVPDIPEDCPEELSYIMKRCWRFEPKERPTINRIVKDLFNATELMEQWQMVDTFKPKDNHNRKLKANRIACFPNGDIIVADNYEHHHRYMITMDGKYKTALTNHQYAINYASSITVTSKSFAAVTDWESKFVTVFSIDGAFVTRFQAASTETDYNLTGITSDESGNLIVKASQEGTVTWYSCPEGQPLRTIKVSERAQELLWIAVNKQQQLILYDNCTSTGHEKVLVIDKSGREVFAINPQIGEHATAKTYAGMEVGLCGLVTGENDDIFVAMKVCEPNIASYGGKIGRSNTGHIHRYNSSGEFQQCIIRGLHSPHDLAMTPDGSLIVANDDTILKYSIVSV